ncbi:DUF4833 domain-containing protein [Flavobacterium rhizosphaerae]|uniref:DUF4833 domain-containing protein n=1 Tax=Flavobacterium rhizosphaerae TaxID=3163298 RepID=A0ABW8YZ96_9FLAO
MKFYTITILIFSLFMGQAQQGYPVPPAARGHLFYIQHSNNHNTYVYDANFAGKKINASDPVTVYCIAFSDDGEKKELTAIQRKMAYGITVIKADGNTCEFVLAAYEQKSLFLKIGKDGKPYVTVHVNGKNIILQRIFLQTKGMGVKIEYIKFYGKDAATGKDIVEQMDINS